MAIIRVRTALLKVNPVQTLSRTAAKVIPATIVRVKSALLKMKPVVTITRNAVVICHAMTMRSAVNRMVLYHCLT